MGDENRPDIRSAGAVSLSNVPSMGQIEDAAAGIRLAEDVAISAAQGDQDAMLKLINSSEPSHLGFATAYLSQMVAASFKALADDDAGRGLAMLVAACGEDSDTFETQARILLSEDS